MKHAGIVYAADWLYEAAEAGAPTTCTEQLRKGFREEWAPVGRISACRIIRVTPSHHSSVDHVLTELTIAPEEALAGAYR